MAQTIGQILTDIILFIIIPEYIGLCLDSCINQTIQNGSYEIIYVNDGSTDNLLAIINECYWKDERIKVIDQENRGVLVAHNIVDEDEIPALSLQIPEDSYFTDNHIKLLSVGKFTT